MNKIMNSIVLENIVKSTPNDQELGAYIRKFFLESEDVKQEKTTKQPVTECYDRKQTVEFSIYDWIIERMDYSQLWKEIMKRAKELKGSDLSAYDIWKLGNLSGSYEIIIEPFNRFAETLKKQRLERMRNFLRSMKKP